MKIDALPILTITFSIVFPFWPLFLLFGLFRGFKNISRLLGTMLIVWCIVGGMRLFLAFTSTPIPNFLIHEPASTILFISIGLLLALGFFGIKYWRRKNDEMIFASPAVSHQTPSLQQVSPAQSNNTIHPNILILEKRMDDALARKDYADVLHSSASIFETMAKDIVGIPTVQNKTLKQFFQRYRKDSALPKEILNYILALYERRNVTPLAGHGSTKSPNITEQEAIALSEMTKAFVSMEYKQHSKK